MSFPIKIKDITSNKEGKKLFHRLNNDDPSLTKLRLIKGGQQTYYPDSREEWALLGHMIGKNKQVDTIALFMRHRKRTKLLCTPFYEGLQHNRSIKSFHLDRFDLRPWNSIIKNLCSFIKINHNLTDLTFECCVIGRGSARLLSSALRYRETKSLTHFSFSFSKLAVDPFTDIVEAISLHAKLECLELSELYDENGGTINRCVEMAARILSKASFKGLQQCILFGNDIDSDSCTALSLAIANKLELKTLVLAGNTIGIQGIRSLATALTNCSKMETLELCGNNIDDEGLLILMPALSCMKHLQVLDLSYTMLTSLRGFEVMSKCKGLVDLDLSGNSITDGGIDILVDTLKCNPSLLSLNLIFNDGISPEGWKLVSTLLNSPTPCKLEELRVGRDNFDDEVAVTFADALSNNSTMKYLSLGGSVTAAGWEAFSTLLCDRSSVESTYLSNHTLSSLGYGGPPAGNDLLKKVLDMNKGTNKKHVAIRKILLFHKDINMFPFFKWDLKILPFMMKWLATAADIPVDFETFIDKRRLSAIFQFVQNVSWLCTM